ncbi:MAG TPA: FAD-dependent oxidoreductase, partial [Pseudobdellovibrionaceae bacterium]|nr:FAD-dependent oxidoreductase [Pseudobdellovibrionaceae bacterium]
MVNETVSSNHELDRLEQSSIQSTRPKSIHTSKYQQPDVIIIGAGFSGLSLAYYLLKAGLTVEIFEKSHRCGGLIDTIDTEFGPVETAANSFILTPKSQQFLRELNLEPLLADKKSRKRFIFRNRPKVWPLTFSETLSSIPYIVSFLRRYLFTRVSLLANETESLYVWAERNLGSALAEHLVTPAIQGIYILDAKELNASLIVNPILLKKKTPGDQYLGICSFQGGMKTLIHSLETRIRALGGVIHLNTAWNSQTAEARGLHSIEQNPWIVCCTSARDAIEVLETPTLKNRGVSQHLIDRLKSVRSLS